MKKSTLVSAVVFLALLAATFLVTSRKAERGISRVSYAELSTEAVDRIVITGKNPVVLKKVEGDWHLDNGKAADSGAVMRLLESVPKIKSSELLSKDSAKYAEFEVDAEKGSAIAVYVGKDKIADFVVGKSLSGGLAMRFADQVFKVAGASQYNFSKATTAWIEHKLFADKVEDASRLEVKLAGQVPYALVKQNSVWQLEDPKQLPAGFRFDADAARALVSAVASMRAKDFEDQDPGVEKTGLSEKADVFELMITPSVPAATDAKAGEVAAAAAPGGGASTAPVVASGGPAAATKPEVGKPDAAKVDAAAAGAPKASAAKIETAPAPILRAVRLGGQKAGDAKDVYARIDGREDLFTLAEYAVKNVRKRIVDLRDLSLVKLDRTQVEKLAVVDGKVELSFEKKDNAWVLARSKEAKPADFELDPTAVDRRVSSLATARGLKLVEGKANTGLGGGGARITATQKGGATVSLAFGNTTKDEDREVVYAQGNADKGVYLVAKWTKDNLLGGLQSFKKQMEPAGGGGFDNIDPKALANLPPDVRDSLMRQIEQKRREQEMLKRLQQQAAGAPK